MDFGRRGGPSAARSASFKKSKKRKISPREQATNLTEQHTKHRRRRKRPAHPFSSFSAHLGASMGTARTSGGRGGWQCAGAIVCAISLVLLLAPGGLASPSSGLLQIVRGEISACNRATTGQASPPARKWSLPRVQTVQPWGFLCFFLPSLPAAVHRVPPTAKSQPVFCRLPPAREHHFPLGFPPSIRKSASRF